MVDDLPDPIPDFSTILPDRDVLHLILLTVRELRGHVVRIVGFAELISDVLENPHEHTDRAIDDYVATLSQSANITHQSLEHIRQNLEVRYRDSTPHVDAFSMAMSDMEILALINIRLNELRSIMANIVGYGNVISLVLEGPNSDNSTSIDRALSYLTPNARAVEATIERICQHLEERLSDK